MADREKVMNGLECCAQMAGEVCRKCPYANECEESDGLLGGAAHLAADALELLKSDEPVKPIHLHNTKIHDSLKDVVFEDECGNCNGYLLRTWKACPICGRKVMWDG